MIQRETLASFYDNALDGIYVLDRDGNYIYANAAYLRISGGNMEDISNLNVFHLLESGHMGESAAVKAFEQKHQVSMINRVSSQNGYIFHQVITAIPLYDGNGDVAHMLVEVTDLHTLNQRIQNAYNISSESTEREEKELSKDAENIIAVSPIMRNILAMTSEIAKVDSSVLLIGETGTGKDVVAHYIHNHSFRSKMPMVSINCAALPESLLESELFGYVKGAYTGALSTGKEGLFQRAQGGTILLDEINSMPLAIQGKLLRVLETKRVKPLGASREEPVDFRLLAATNKDLNECIQNGTFRSDLYYRISVIPIELPPLRAHPEDVQPLAWHFMDYYCRKYNRTRILTPTILTQLEQYDWPGNVRELKNIIERLVVTSSSDSFELNQLPQHILHENKPEKLIPPYVPNDWEMAYASDPENFSLKSYINAYESQIIASALKQCGNTRAAAKMLKIDHSTIIRKLQRGRSE